MLIYLFCIMPSQKRKISKCNMVELYVSLRGFCHKFHPKAARDQEQTFLGCEMLEG